jgi:hypothetical protein
VYPFLAQVVADLWPQQRLYGGGWDLAHAWTRLDYLAKFPFVPHGSSYGGGASQQLHAAILEVYGDPLCAETDELCNSGRRSTLLDIIGDLRPDDVLISFNWDVVAELVANHLRVNLVQAPLSIGSGAIKLVKPHGSVSWVSNLIAHAGYVDLRATPAPCVSPMKPSDVTAHAEPFLLGAVPIKTELIVEAQGTDPRNPHAVVCEQWSDLMGAIETADEVIVAGYSFPDDDTYGRFLVQEAVSRRCEPLKRVRFYDIDSARASMTDKLVDILQPAARPIYLGPVS